MQLLTVAAGVQEALLSQCQVKRKHLSPALKAQLLAEQENKCKLCGSQLEDCEIDHITPLCEAVAESANEIANLRALCPT